MTKFLVDTHILIFYFTDKSKLTKLQLETIDSKKNEIFVSTISYYEMATLVRLNKVDLGMSISEFYFMQQQHGFKDLNYGIAELDMLSKIIPIPNHKDPVDLLLICQVIHNKIDIITNDKNILKYVIN